MFFYLTSGAAKNYLEKEVSMFYILESNINLHEMNNGRSGFLTWAAVLITVESMWYHDLVKVKNITSKADKNLTIATTQASFWSQLRKMYLL